MRLANLTATSLAAGCTFQRRVPVRTVIGAVKVGELDEHLAQWPGP